MILKTHTPNRKVIIPKDFFLVSFGPLSFSNVPIDTVFHIITQKLELQTYCITLPKDIFLFFITLCCTFIYFKCND